jgi:hypothetical protein
MRLRHLRWRSWSRSRAILGTCIGILFLTGVAALAAPGSAGAVTARSEYYLALGGSGSVGEQPTMLSPRGQRTDDGYANDLFDLERARWADLRLVKLGCPGETTMTMLDGGAHCHYDGGTQLADAVAFLHLHPSTVLVTLDLGFNDIRPCLIQQRVDQPCVTRAIDVVRDQMSQILTALHAAEPPGARLVGVGHYDPYLAAYLEGPAGRAFALQSLGVIARLNDALRSAYAAADVPMADVAASFATTDTKVATLAGVGTVPQDVARACAYTWMCAPTPLGPNQHPNDTGYRAISAAIDDALADRQ